MCRPPVSRPSHALAVRCDPGALNMLLKLEQKSNTRSPRIFLPGDIGIWISVLAHRGCPTRSAPISSAPELACNVASVMKKVGVSRSPSRTRRHLSTPGTWFRSLPRLPIHLSLLAPSASSPKQLGQETVNDNICTPTDDVSWSAESQIPMNICPDSNGKDGAVPSTRV
jgi:hypothetical protein